MAYNPKNLVTVFDAGNPFRDDPTNADSYYAAIGRIVVMWGRFESLLEQVIQMMGRVPDAVKSRGAPPVSYKLKLKRIKTLCRDTPSLNHIHENARAFASSAAILSRKRHDLTHANWQGFARNAPEPTVIFSNIRWDTENVNYDKRPIPLSELEALLAEILRLNETLFDKLFSEVTHLLAQASQKPSKPS